MTCFLIMEVSCLSVIPDSDEGAWSGNHGICLVLGRIFPSIEIDFFVFGTKMRLFFDRVDALGSMSSVIWVLAAEWIPDSSLTLVRNDEFLDNGSVAPKCHSR
ncbi:hypothetical protein VVYB158_19570 [Vibrio vulnificus CladeA-yb158]|nr:hypothetical protein VVYB158_19570 [Vibrio vulnificus CladeA-yb158]RZQ20347.1 hypothetical protein D8T50_06405 [Vibrio vulnificus]HAS8172196.1 hypothetical protein [Vibrio vulnificus]HAS8446310.1 hypothetical protein [Vibrio vulnificus]HAS8453836.1 hypothetical protein [Vibrio vulnificus]